MNVTSSKRQIVELEERGPVGDPSRMGGMLNRVKMGGKLTKYSQPKAGPKRHKTISAVLAQSTEATEVPQRLGAGPPKRAKGTRVRIRFQENPGYIFMGP